MKYGLRPKIHANELDYSGGIQVGVKYNALSVDHLEYTGDAEIEALKDSETMPTILPGAAFFLNMPYALLENDRSRTSCSHGKRLQPRIFTFRKYAACFINGKHLYRMTPEEGINATTINSAYAMDLSREMGSIAVGKIANVFITKPIPSYQYMPYYYGSNKVDTAILNGVVECVN